MLDPKKKNVVPLTDSGNILFFGKKMNAPMFFFRKLLENSRKIIFISTYLINKNLKIKARIIVDFYNKNQLCEN